MGNAETNGALAQRTALITGSCWKGIGRSTALRLARDGANIVLNYGTHRHGAEARRYADEIAKAIVELGGHAIVQEADTTDEAHVQAMVGAAREAFGGVDILVVNAGGDWIVKDYTEIDFGQWKTVLAGEIDSAFLLMKHVVPEMRRCRWGRVVHIAMDSLMAARGVEGLAPDYSLGKAARSWMTTAFGLQEFDKGVTVNCVEPGLTAQMEFEEALEAVRGDDASWRQRDNVTCHDIAEIVAFLCSEAARFVSGSVIRVPTGT